MTQPIPHGYNDFGRYIASADKVFVNDLQILAVAGVSYGMFFVGDVPAISLQMQNAAGANRIRVEYFDAVTPTAALATHWIEMPNISNVDIVLPNLGPYMMIHVEAPTVPASWHIIVASCSSRMSGLGNDIRNHILFNQVNTPVGAGATVSTNALFIHPGPAIITLDTLLATWVATVNMVDALAGVTRIDTFRETHVKAPRQYYLAAQRLQLNFTNTTGAAGQFTCAAMAMPMWPGS